MAISPLPDRSPGSVPGMGNESQTVPWNCLESRKRFGPRDSNRIAPLVSSLPFLSIFMLARDLMSHSRSRWKPVESCTYPCANGRGTSDAQDVVCERQRVKDRDQLAAIASQNYLAVSDLFVTGLRSLICATAALGLRSTSIRFRQRVVLVCLAANALCA